MTRKVLSERTGISPRFIAQLEAGMGNISLGNLSDVARALALPLRALLPAEEHEVDADGSTRLRAEARERLDRVTPAVLTRALDVLRSGEEAPVESRPVIALTGLRGAGKSTIGPLLAAALGIPYVELDERIVERTGLAVPEIFELHGEDYYRQAERHALRDLLDAGEPVVVSVSGGIVDDAESLALLKGRTVCLWLKATPELHMNRVRSQGDNRPMQNRPNAMAELRQLLIDRVPLYQQAQLVVETTDRDPALCAAEAAERLRRLPGAPWRAGNGQGPTAPARSA
jgi:XRE family aerobic/anaerobic benzoate catabolism transcriptional regulator